MITNKYIIKLTTIVMLITTFYAVKYIKHSAIKPWAESTPASDNGRHYSSPNQWPGAEQPQTAESAAPTDRERSDQGHNSQRIGRHYSIHSRRPRAQ